MDRQETSTSPELPAIDLEALGSESHEHGRVPSYELGQTEKHILCLPTPSAILLLGQWDYGRALMV